MTPPSALRGKFTYRGEFVLAWLASDETVESAGPGTDGACVVRWPGGQLRIEKGQKIVRGEDGRLVYLSHKGGSYTDPASKASPVMVAPESSGPLPFGGSQ